MPYPDLWAWYRDFKERFPKWAERREHIASIYRPLLAAVLSAAAAIPAPVEPTGWERVDRALAKAREVAVGARHEEDFQSVGLLCREVLISLGQAVYDPAEHPPIDDKAPSSTDASRMLGAYIAATLRGESNEVLRAHAKAALKLAVELQHSRSANFRLAALCFEATSSVTETIAIITGRRDPSR